MKIEMDKEIDKEIKKFKKQVEDLHDVIMKTGNPEAIALLVINKLSEWTIENPHPVTRI